MHVQTFDAAHGAAIAFFGAHICLTFVAMLVATAARPGAAEIADLLAWSPGVRVIDVVARTQQ